MTRHLTREDAAGLPPGGDHYSAYVGPPDQYDVMGASQFRLLTTLGLRDYHRVLDFGCGSLRAGRLLIPYLQKGQYFGIEPNRWLIDDAIANETGQDLIDLKQPQFSYNSDFSVGFGVKFDFILAQSIFSHTGRDLIAKALAEFRGSLESSGLILATFILPEQLGSAGDFQGEGWVYPGCVAYTQETVLRLIEGAGLVGRRLPWLHPRQTWFAIAHSDSHLPSRPDDASLSGLLLERARR